MFKKSRFFAVLLSCFIGIGTSLSSYQDAYANPLVVVAGVEVAVDAGLAVAWLLGACGFVSASVIVYKRADDFRAFGNSMLSAFRRFLTLPNPQLTADGEVASQVDAWVAKLCEGTLDTSSACWADFKLWLNSLSLDSQKGGFLPPYSLASSAPALQSQFSFHVWQSSELPLTPISLNLFCFNDSFSGPVAYLVSPINFGYSIVTPSASWTVPGASWNRAILDGYPATDMFYNRITGLSSSDVCNLFGLTADQMPSMNQGNKNKLLSSVFFSCIVSAALVPAYSHVHSGLDTVYERDKTYANVDVVSTHPVTGVLPTDVAIDWTGTGDLSGVLSDVYTGTLSPTDVWTHVGVTVTDVVTDTVLNPSQETDRPGEGEVVVVPPGLVEFTIPDLSTVFPFCLPFDLIDFFNVLDAPAEAPHFKIPFSYPTIHGMAVYDVDIDLSVFNSVAELLRTMETLAFIVGLIFLTREKMIRG